MGQDNAFITVSAVNHSRDAISETIVLLIRMAKCPPAVYHLRQVVPYLRHANPLRIMVIPL
jgi:hypothetical protein